MCGAKGGWGASSGSVSQRPKPTSRNAVDGTAEPAPLTKAGYQRALSLRADEAKVVRGGWVGFKWWLVVVVMLGAWDGASASGPRWVTGPPFFTGQPGVAVGWRPGALTYTTDPGDLSATVNHAAADALVAAAAGVWNLPVANLTIAQAGMLGERVSGANVYLGSSGLVWPTDVASINHAAMPIAVVYDRDGSVTDLLLGGGASAPSNCRQNGVTEDVDLFDPAGYILHAVVIVNGRCTGSAPQAQLQLQYQMMRAFGRVLGLAWSQTNDNVFTGVPTATPAQTQHWPVMHPIDILCGPYTYQCMPQPFVLRPDDMASMVLLYGIGPHDAVPAGKQVSLAQATSQAGTIAFPDGQGMAGVNVQVRRMPGRGNLVDGWAETSSVTGTWFRRSVATPLSPQGTDALSSQGDFNAFSQGYFRMAYIPWPTGAEFENHVLSTEPVNPLYIGEYSLGAYGPGTVKPSGTAPGGVVRYLSVGDGIDWNTTVADATVDCGSASADGTESLPVQAEATGWWNGTICGVGHTAWFGLDVKAGRSLTLDVAAVDEAGLYSTTKLMPVLGAWKSSDALGTQPTLGVTAAAFNATSVGTSRLGLASSQAGRLRLMIADQRGEGRPDFGYRGRILYADTIVPALIPAAGATVTIYGMGFRTGNAVTINGVAAAVTGWSASSLTVVVPAMAVVHTTLGVALDVVVTDRSTGAVSAMAGALSYDASALPETMRLVSAPVGSILSGSVAATPFAVQVLRGDGVTPVAGEAVVLSVAVGSAQLGVCGAAICTVNTDAQGMASSTVAPLAAGGVTLQAAGGSMSQSASFTALAAVGSVVLQHAPSGDVPVQVTTEWVTARALRADGNPAYGVPLTLTSIPAGAVRFTACLATSCTVTTNGNGIGESGIMLMTTGPVQLVATAGGTTAAASFTAVGSPDVLTVMSAPSGTSYVGSSTPLAFMAELFAGDGVTPLWGRNLVFTAPPGVVLDVCGASTCTLTSVYSATGTTVTPQIAGTFTLQVTDGVTVRTATFTAVPRTARMKVLSAPADGSAVNVAATQPFSAQMLDGWGNPWPGRSVTLTPMQRGSAAILGCYELTSCTLIADANGIVSTQVMPLIAGPISLQALAGNISETVSFVASAVQATVTAAQPALYVAEGATLDWTLSAGLMLNGSAAAGQIVSWTGATGLTPQTQQKLSDAMGAAQSVAVVGPLAGNAVATATACAWGAVCAGYRATGVSRDSLRVTVVSGLVAASGAAFTPVVLQVIDLAGHPVAGAAVTIYQTASEAVACPSRGRCPSAPVVASGTSSAVSDIDGRMSLPLLVWTGGSGVTHLAAAVGTQGFVAVDVSTVP